jgi:hypothetical protein
LLKAYETQAEDLARQLECAADAVQDPTSAERDIQELANLYRQGYDLITQTGTFLIESQSVFIRLFCGRFFKNRQAQLLKGLLAKSAGFTDRAYTARLRLDASVERTDLTSLAQFDPVSDQARVDLQRPSQKTRVDVEVPRTRALRSGNETPITLPFPFEHGLWPSTFLKCCPHQPGEVPNVKLLPITEKTAKNVINQLLADYFHGNMPDVSNVASIRGAFGFPEIASFDGWGEKDKCQVIGLFNLLLSAISALPRESPEFKNAKDLCAMLLVGVGPDGQYVKSPFKEILDISCKLMSPISHLGMGAATSNLPNIDELSTFDSHTVQQQAMLRYKGMEFMQHACSKPITLFTGAVMEKFATYASSPDAMRHIQAVIMRLSRDSRVEAVLELAKFANELAASIKGQNDPGTLNQLRAISELLLANKDVFQGSEQFVDLFSVSDGIIRKWNHSGGINSNEIAAVVQIAALKTACGVKLSPAENKHIALIAADPRYGFCQRVYNAAELDAAGEKFDPPTNPNFRAFYGGEDSLVPMDAFGSVPAIADPSEFVTADDVKAAFGLAVKVDRANGLILSEDGKLLVATREKPPFVEKLDTVKILLGSGKSIDSRSAFPDPNKQVIDDLVTVDLTTGEAAHKVAGKFVELPNLNIPSLYVAFQGGDNVVRVYSASNFAEPVFLIEGGKFYSPRNPDIELHMGTFEQISALGISLPSAERLNLFGGLIGLDNSGNIAEVVAFVPVCLEKGEASVPIAFSRGASGRLELFADGRPTDQYLVHREALETYLPGKLTRILCVATDSSPRELLLLQPSLLGAKTPAIVTLPEEKNGAIILGRVKDGGETEGAIEAKELLKPHMCRLPTMQLVVEGAEQNQGTKNRLRSLIAYCRAGREFEERTDRYFSVRNGFDSEISMAVFDELLAAWENSKENLSDPEYVALLGEALLESAANNYWQFTGMSDVKINSIGEKLNDAYLWLRAFSPASQALSVFARLADSLNCQIKDYEGIHSTSVKNHILSRIADAKFYRMEVMRFRKRRGMERLQNIRAHLPKPAKHAPGHLKRVDFARDAVGDLQKMAGSAVKRELFGQEQFDLATVGARALEILNGGAPIQSVPAVPDTDAGAMTESDENASPVIPAAERQRLEQHRQRKAEETQVYADALWGSIAQHFDGTFDLAHPENFQLAEASKGELQRKLNDAEASLGTLENGTPVSGDALKVYQAYQEATQVIEGIFQNVNLNVKQMRLHGDLPMPTLERLQMMLFSHYNYREKKIDEKAFFEAYRRQFDPYATLGQVQDIIGAIQDQMICKTALDASKTRVREFSNFKRKIDQLINPPETTGIQGLNELNERRKVLQQAQAICQSYGAQEMAYRQLETEKITTMEQHTAAVLDLDRKIAENETKQREIQEQIDVFGKSHSSSFFRDGFATKIDQASYVINGDKINQKVQEISDEIDKFNVQITAALPHLNKQQSELRDDDVIVAGGLLGYGKANYGDVKAKLAKLETEKRSLTVALELKTTKDGLIQANAALANAKAELEEKHIEIIEKLAAQIKGVNGAKSELRAKFAALQTAHGQLLGHITLRDEDLVLQTLEAGNVLILPGMEARMAANEWEIESLVGGTKGRMLAAKEAYGGFIKAMAAARAYDADDMANFFTMWFESQTGFRLRPDQVTMTGNLAEKVRSSDSNDMEIQALFQLMMGGGKTAIILSQIAQILAGHGKIALFANHSSQHATMTKDLRKYQQDRYGQNVIEIDYPITALVEKFDEIFEQFKLAKLTGACVTMPSTTLRGIVLERRNAIIRLSECRTKLANESRVQERKNIRSEIVQLEMKLKKFEKLLSFIRENCAMICDEVDLNLDPNFRVNIPSGEKRTFDQVQASCIGKFFKVIDGNNAIKDALRNGNGIAEETLGKVADQMLNELEIQEGAPRELYRRFICYDDTPGAPVAEDNDAFRQAWDAERVRLAGLGGDDAELLERLAMLRGLIATEREASKKAFLESYGFRVDGQGEVDVRKKVVRAVPYSAANTPSSGEYAHPIELAVYTYHAYLLANPPAYGDGAPLSLKFEAFVQRAIDSPDSHEGKYLDSLVPNFAQDAKDSQSASTPASRENLARRAFAQLATIYGRNGGDKERNSLIAMLTASDFTFFPAMLEGTGYGQTHLTKLVIADSGTPWNAEILSVGFQDNPMLDETTDMRILDKWEKDMAAGSSVVFPARVENPSVAAILDEQAKAHGNDGKPTCSLIDVAGIFKHLSNRQVAEQARDYYARHGAPFKGFAFFDTKEKSWFVLPRDPHADLVKLSDCTEKTVFLEAGVTREELCVYYDQDKTTGVDFKSPQSGRGCVTVDPKKTLLSRFLQGILRLRGFWDGQTADICQVGGQVDAVRMEPYQHAERLCELFGAIRTNQDQLLNGRKVAAFVGQLTERKREILERAQQDYYQRHKWAIEHGSSPFVPSYWKREYEKIQAAADRAFKTDATFDPVNWYASPKSSMSAVEYVKEMRKTMAESLKEFGLDGEFMIVTESIAKKGNEQLQGVQTAVGGSSVEPGAAVEQQAEQQMEVAMSSVGNDDESKIGRSIPDQYYVPNAKLDTGIQMGLFAKTLLPSIAKGLTGEERLKVLRLVPVVAPLFAADDVSVCREKFEQNTIKSTSTLKIPLKFFDAMAQRAKAVGVDGNALVEQMNALRNAVDKIFGRPAHKGSNPDSAKIVDYFKCGEATDLRSLCGAEAFAELALAMGKAGMSEDQAKQFVAQLRTYSGKVDELVAAAQNPPEEGADQADARGLVSLKDFQTNPVRALGGLQAKLGPGTILALVNDGILPLLAIFTEKGEIGVGDITRSFGDAVGMMGNMLKAAVTRDRSGAMNEIQTILERVNSLTYVEKLDAPRKQKILAWFHGTLPKLLGKFFVQKESDAAGFLLKIALEMTLPPADPTSAQKKLALAILDGSKDPKTDQYDMAEAIRFLDKLINEYRNFADEVLNLEGNMAKMFAGVANTEIAKGIVTLLGKLYKPLFVPLLDALNGVKGSLLEAGGQAADQLLVRRDNAEADDKGKFPTCRMTDGAKTVSAWVKESRERMDGADATIDIFPDDILASVQFMKPFEYGNDPTSAHFARNAQRMLVYVDSSGAVKGMLVTDAEVDNYGTMIREGALKNAYFMDSRGQIDPKYLPPSCKGGALPAEDRNLTKIQAECSRFALYMRVYNGSVSLETLDRNPAMGEIFRRDIIADPSKKSAVTAFLGTKMPDTTWVDRVSIAA